MGVCAYLAIRVRGAEDADADGVAVAVLGVDRAVSVDAEALVHAAGAGVGRLVQRTLVADPGQAPIPMCARLALGICRAAKAGAAVARRRAGASGRREGVGGALNDGRSSWAVGVGGALCACCRWAVEARVALALGLQTRFRWRVGVAGTEAQLAARAVFVRSARRARGVGCSVALISRQTNALGDAGRAQRRSGVGRARKDGGCGDRGRGRVGGGVGGRRWWC